VNSAEIVRFAAPLWRWTGGNGGSWHFVTAEGAAAEAIAAHALIRRLEEGRARGFGSVRVEVRIRESCWTTSVFPHSDGGWILPVKRPIRRAEDLAEGDMAEIELRLL
jgi:hypothetical protein